MKNTVRRLLKPYSTSIDGSFQIVKEQKKQTKQDTSGAVSYSNQYLTAFAFCLSQ
jgi:hypothetical protein